MTPLHIRWMIRRDMPEVLQIERDAFDAAWTDDDFCRALRQRNCIGHVGEVGETIAAFMLYELQKTKIEILNFAVGLPFRRKGYGAAMVTKRVGKLSSHRRRVIIAAVRESNLSAQLFFRSCGFEAAEVLRTFYEDTNEDAYVMRYLLRSEDGEVVEPVNRIAQYEEET